MKYLIFLIIFSCSESLEAPLQIQNLPPPEEDGCYEYVQINDVYGNDAIDATVEFTLSSIPNKLFIVTGNDTSFIQVNGIYYSAIFNWRLYPRSITSEYHKCTITQSF